MLGGVRVNSKLKLTASIVLFLVLLLVMLPDMLKGEPKKQTEEDIFSEEPSKNEFPEVEESQASPEEPSYMFAIGNLNIRSGPGMENDIVKVIPTGEKVLVSERGDIWYKVTYREVSGYSHSDYLSNHLGDDLETTPGNQTPVEGLKLVDGIILVNKQYKLPSEYSPGEDPVAKAKLGEMLLQGEKEIKRPMHAFSGYRSYSYQEDLYLSDLYNYGQEYVDKFTAKPGYSEHQTGLAFDIGGESKCWADPCFDDTEEAKWLAENAHRFGFILRYPKEKEDITGYGYESWHFRYVGEEHAVKIYNLGVTLEEYLQNL